MSIPHLQRLLKRYITGGEHHIGSEELIDKILDKSRFGALYLQLLSGAIILATLGLLINSPTVIIGAMIVSPLMWPVIRIAVGIASADKSLLYRGIMLLSFSIAAIIGVAYGITMMSPIKSVTAEIAFRTSPTIIDLFVAIVSALIAALSLLNKKISDSIAGVALATALLPPLCVTGIGLALGDMTIASTSILLATANITAILCVMTMVFSLLSRPSAKKRPLRIQGFIVEIMLLILVSIPLLVLFSRYVQNVRSDAVIREVLSQAIIEYPYVTLEEVTIGFPPPFTDNNQVSVTASLLLPESLVLGQELQQSLLEKLEMQSNRQVDLELKLQRSVELVSPQDQLIGAHIKELRSKTESALKQMYSSIRIESIDVLFDKDDTWNVAVTVYTDPRSPLSASAEALLLQELKQETDDEVRVTITALPRIDFSASEATDQIEELIMTLPNTITSSIEVSNNSITGVVYYSSRPPTARQLDLLEEQIASQSGRTYTLDLVFVRSEQLR